ncbi:hypothetical protein [Ligilactobacillus salivarius]|nr:hypothetical protein [Ligilactobacillus salivarius]
MKKQGLAQAVQQQQENYGITTVYKRVMLNASILLIAIRFF